MKSGSLFSMKDFMPSLEIVGLKQRQQLQEQHMVHVVVERFVHAHSHHALGGLHRHRRVGRNFCCETVRGFREFVVIDDS